MSCPPSTVPCLWISFISLSILPNISNLHIPTLECTNLLMSPQHVAITPHNPNDNHFTHWLSQNRYFISSSVGISGKPFNLTGRGVFGRLPIGGDPSAYSERVGDMATVLGSFCQHKLRVSWEDFTWGIAFTRLACSEVCGDIFLINDWNEKPKPTVGSATVDR